jgi:hypothetical protein
MLASSPSSASAAADAVWLAVAGSDSAVSAWPRLADSRLVINVSSELTAADVSPVPSTERS